MKAVLVMEMPDGCGGCRLASWQQGRVYCKVTGKGIKAMSKREDFCPLRQMPKKVTETLDDGSFCDGCDHGWNDCIGAIEGSEEDDKP